MASKIVRCIDRTAEMFSGSSNPFIPESVQQSAALKKAYKRNNDYSSAPIHAETRSSTTSEGVMVTVSSNPDSSSRAQSSSNDQQMVTHRPQGAGGGAASSAPHSRGVMVPRRAPQKVPVPQWHPKWELGVVLSGHLGWVRSISFDPSNQWFATGSNDRTIKIWDFPKSVLGDKDCLKLTLTGHISGVRGLAVSDRHPYLFSAGEDKMVKCWDLEYNKVVRHYHGHLSGVFALSLHPILDLLISGGRDSVARVWDMRTKNQVHVLGGHVSTVSSILTSGIDPQVITGSYDSTIKQFDLAAGKCMSTLTHHKKSVRALCANPRELSFVSAGADNLKKWQTRDGKFLQNMSEHNSVINSVSVNEDGVFASCADDGSLHFSDYKTGYNFQKIKSIAQPGSLDAESGVFASTFDLSGSRLITCEADKTIKIWKENRDSTEDSDPVDLEGWTKQCLALKRH